MQFRILGPLEIGNGKGGGGVSVETPKLRALLGVLLLHANEVVSSERLIDELWGERPPATAPKLVQTYVSQLRRQLGPDTIETRAPGYLLPVGEGDLDAARFRRLTEEAQRLAAADEQEQARRFYREALGLWRGPPLADVPFESFARNEADRLEDERLGSLMNLIDCELALGRHDQVVPELEALVARHPLRERLRAQLMLALYRSGRQADALAVYQAARRSLVEELGLEPGRELQDLEKAVLTHDLALEALPRSAPSADRTAAALRVNRWRAAALVAAVGLAIGLLLAFAFSRRSEASLKLAANSVGFIDSESAHVKKSFAVGREPRALAVGFGSVWVANYGNWTVSRISRDSERPVTIPLGGRLHPTGIAAYGEMIWVWTLEGRLVPIDPGYNRPETPISLRRGIVAARNRGGGIAAGGGFLWIADAPTTVIRVDPTDPRRHRKLIHPDDDGVAGPITYDGGKAWIGGYSQVYSIAPVSDIIGTGTNVGLVRGLAFAAGDLWVASGNPGHTGGVVQALRRVDVNSQQIEHRIAVGSDPLAVAVAGGSVWAASRSDGTVYRVDPAENEVVDTIQVGARPTALAADADGVWVAVR